MVSLATKAISPAGLLRAEESKSGWGVVLGECAGVVEAVDKGIGAGVSHPGPLSYHHLLSEVDLLSFGWSFTAQQQEDNLTAGLGNIPSQHASCFPKSSRLLGMFSECVGEVDISGVIAGSVVCKNSERAVSTTRWWR